MASRIFTIVVFTFAAFTSHGQTSPTVFCSDFTQKVNRDSVNKETTLLEKMNVAFLTHTQTDSKNNPLSKKITFASTDIVNSADTKKKKETKSN